MQKLFFYEILLSYLWNGHLSRRHKLRFLKGVYEQVGIGILCQVVTNPMKRHVCPVELISPVFMRALFGFWSIKKYQAIKPKFCLKTPV